MLGTLVCKREVVVRAAVRVLLEKLRQVVVETVRYRGLPFVIKATAHTNGVVVANRANQIQTIVGHAAIVSGVSSADR